MEGIKTAFEGRISAPDGLKFTAGGTAALSFGVVVAVDKKGTAQWLRVTIWGDLAEELAPVLEKGMEVYVEGDLTLNEWEAGGEKRHGLSISARRCEPLGLIGHRAPRARQPQRPQPRAALASAVN